MYAQNKGLKLKKTVRGDFWNNESLLFSYQVQNHFSELIRACLDQRTRYVWLIGRYFGSFNIYSKIYFNVFLSLKVILAETLQKFSNIHFLIKFYRLKLSLISWSHKHALRAYQYLEILYQYSIIPKLQFRYNMICTKIILADIFGLCHA